MSLEITNDGPAADTGDEAPHPFVIDAERERVLHAAAVATGELGYPDLTEQAIADRAGVTLEGFHRHFPDAVAEHVVGGIYEIVFSRIFQGATDELPGLLPDLMYCATVPYLGPRRAALAARKARREIS